MRGSIDVERQHFRLYVTQFLWAYFPYPRAGEIRENDFKGPFILTLDNWEMKRVYPLQVTFLALALCVRIYI